MAHFQRKWNNLSSIAPLINGVQPGIPRIFERGWAEKGLQDFALVLGFLKTKRNKEGFIHQSYPPDE